ncbi:MAG: Fic family protein [Actinomycetota bacterium]|nr:Fic family protein [Actinomycetota bacterium]
MIYATPPRRAADEAALEAIDRLRQELRFFLREPRRWYGSLRRTTLARAVQGSNSIEGYHASVEDVAAIVEDEEPLGASEETRAAIAGYRDAMTYVLQLAGGPVRVDESLIRSLHFMMLKHDLSRHPGQWRPGGIWVEDQDGHSVYTAPQREKLEPLMAEMIEQINTADDDPMITAAMAHLNLALIHPFSDGNGRMARCLQSLVLAKEGIISPEFASIEEYLGHNTAHYYEVLTEVSQGNWHPDWSARPWIEFCLTAHHRQAVTVLRRIRETEALWDRCDQLATTHHLPDRCIGALCDAARGWRLRRSLYVKVILSTSGEEITDATATRDLRAMAEAGLLEPHGEKRARHYTPTPALRRAWDTIRALRPATTIESPYPDDLVADQPPLPGLDG